MVLSRLERVFGRDLEQEFRRIIRSCAPFHCFHQNNSAGFPRIQGVQIRLLIISKPQKIGVHMWLMLTPHILVADSRATQVQFKRVLKSNEQADQLVYDVGPSQILIQLQTDAGNRPDNGDGSQNCVLECQLPSSSARAPRQCLEFCGPSVSTTCFGCFERTIKPWGLGTPGKPLRKQDPGKHTYLTGFQVPCCLTSCQ